jgi:ribosomal protein S20|tara:strand:+ start:82 stop:234 length:153 start_codon:yes stop_codon:yes gene_type:complete
MIDVKTDIKKFIDNVMKRDYQKSSNNLSDVIDQKIKQKIINNNIKIFNHE